MADYGKARVLDEAELRRLRNEAVSGKYGLRNVCIVDFSYLCGLRSKEISALKISNVVGADESIKDSFHLDRDNTKGDRGRTVYLSNKGLRKRLQAYIDSRDTGCVDSGTMLFKSQKKSFCSQSIQNLFRKLYGDAGLEGCSSHSGRRTFATNLIMKGYDIKSVSVLMGHSSIQMTSKYIQENPVVMSDMVASL